MTKSFRFLNILFIILTAEVLLWITVFTLTRASPLKFVNTSEEQSFFEIACYLVPFWILVLVLRTIRPESKYFEKALTLCFGIGAYYISYKIFLGYMMFVNCSWETEKILFQNKKSEAEVIGMRILSCGVLESAETSRKIVKIRYLWKPFIWEKKVDSQILKTDNWKRYEGSPDNHN